MDFLDALDSLINAPSQQMYDNWNAWSFQTGLAPGAVLVGINADTGQSWFDIPLNSIDGTAGYQITWHHAESEADTSGPTIDYF